MKRNLKIVTAVLLVVVLAVSVAVPLGIRNAQAIREAGACSFHLALDTSKYEFDLTDVTVDLYRVAQAHSGADDTSFSLEAVDPFTALDIYGNASSAAGLIGLAQQAAHIALPADEEHAVAPAYSATADQTIKNIDAGMYLVILRPTAAEETYFHVDAETGSLTTTITKRIAVADPPEGYPDYKDYVYTFLPMLVTMPYTDTDGSLIYNVNMLPKVGEDANTIPLRITKELTAFTSSATVTFRITGYDADGNKVYGAKDVSINFADGATLRKSLDLNLPDNVVRITVEETYAGAGYRLAVGYEQVVETVLNADGSTEVIFVNEPHGDRQGGSVVNHFTRERDGEWNLVQIYNQPQGGDQ